MAVEFLMKRGFSIIERNYTKKWGEIDIVSQKDKKIYFIEVKSVSRETLDSVNHETNDQYRPEENMHPWKMKRLSRAIQTYLLQNKIREDAEWQIDLLVVFLDMKRRLARVKVVSDIIL